MDERNHFVTMNQMSFVDHSAHKRSHHNLSTSQSRTLDHDLSVGRQMRRDHSQVFERDRSPNMFQNYSRSVNPIAAGVRCMNKSLYNKPMSDGIKNKRFKHPNLQSNLVFYETSPNMRDVESSRFTTTANLMHSFGKLN